MPLFGQRGTPKEGHDCSINRDDIISFVDLLHVQKLDVSIFLFAIVKLSHFLSNIYFTILMFSFYFRFPLFLSIGKRSAWAYYKILSKLIMSMILRMTLGEHIEKWNKINVLVMLMGLTKLKILIYVEKNE